MVQYLHSSTTNWFHSTIYNNSSEWKRKTFLHIICYLNVRVRTIITIHLEKKQIALDCRISRRKGENTPFFHTHTHSYAAKCMFFSFFSQFFFHISLHCNNDNNMQINIKPAPLHSTKISGLSVVAMSVCTFSVWYVTRYIFRYLEYNTIGVKTRKE